MTYSIFVFNQLSFGEIPADVLKSELIKVSFSTLCEQYGLDPRFITETRDNLEVLAARRDVSPYFLVKYQTNDQPPIVVFQQRLSYPGDEVLLKSFVRGQTGQRLVEELERACCIFRIDLEEAQLRDMGLLLGYEIARWLAFLGKGLMRDLQGAWYRLNMNQAFIPFMEE
jgi:hypothetical protein